MHLAGVCRRRDQPADASAVCRERVDLCLFPWPCTRSTSTSCAPIRARPRGGSSVQTRRCRIAWSKNCGWRVRPPWRAGCDFNFALLIVVLQHGNPDRDGKVQSAQFLDVDDGDPFAPRHVVHRFPCEAVKAETGAAVADDMHVVADKSVAGFRDGIEGVKERGIRPPPPGAPALSRTAR